MTWWNVPIRVDVESLGTICHVLDWFHLSCVGFLSVPSGDWYCDECLIEAEGMENRVQSVCSCNRTKDLVEVPECSNQGCQIKLYHKCCVSDNSGDDESIWICELCT